MNKRLISRAFMTMALMLTLVGLVTFAVAPTASAHAQTSVASTQASESGIFVPAKPAQGGAFIANGVVIGYGNLVTDRHGNYEAHVHLSTLPANIGPYVLSIAQGLNETSVQVSSAPQDFYLSNVFAGYPGSIEVSLVSTNANDQNAWYTLSF